MQYLYQESHNRLFIWSEEFGKRSDMREATPAEIGRLLKPAKWSQGESEPISDPAEVVIVADDEFIDAANQFESDVERKVEKLQEFTGSIGLKDAIQEGAEKPVAKRTRRRRK